ncbi:UDP-4-amino-4,6-dideoxy-N-acetyl-beta-L-altrosamine transaminase [Paenibacillus ferrarius]|uniref:UDP-4-amino-4, 6-dideoxy-N-acetyl-beta-L-altrosamine transaminase n=1 Tax=Paenibacillus ferrarius TaxID=1469647 RepID=A0A1V4HGG6_9BACL|nr:UDP-4-amino-4,6-dideoxy-N-acetyl-beta-L-altrosamine transaminase [Paenibacillus ferrarius]OPH54554.1 UDP-4-amino-4,6-dideoxy-N-acetyl-beta-L-altrosamine transaminase [Paenibacillus ferrarius]
MSRLAVHGETPVRDSMLPYGQQWIEEDDIAQVVRVLQSDYLTQGPVIQEFEKKVASYVSAKYAVAFCNGTAALHAACYAAGIGADDEVITTPLTFVASSNCVLYQGGKPVFADIDRRTYNIDPEQIEAKITSRTKALIPVDFTGQPTDMEKINAIARKFGLVVIEDAAHSLGARYQGSKVGAMADMTMFSFHPVKHITTGEGGVIVTDNEEYYQSMLLFRSHGITRDPKKLIDHQGPWYYEMHTLGYNYRMTDLQASLGLSQLNKLEMFLVRRREIAQLYNEAFEVMAGVDTPFQQPDAVSAWHLYILKLDPTQLRGSRKEIFEALRAENIGVNVHYIPVYLQPYYQELGYKRGSCPNAEDVYEQLITLPLYPKMTYSDVNDVIVAVDRVLEYYRLR